MNHHALGVLEFAAVLELLAERAASPLGAARLRTLAPSADREWIEREHARIAAMRALIDGEGGWRSEAIPDIEAPLRRLHAVGSGWSGPELLGAATLLRSSRLTRQALADPRRQAAAAMLVPFAERLITERGAESAIEAAIDEDGSVKDSASPLLRKVRRELRGAQGELVQLLERVMSRLDAHQRVPDMSVTVRNGRYVIPVRREARGAVGGIVHDESATRGTLFVEPPAAVEFGNRIRELEADEQREVERVLVALTDTIRPLRDGMMAALDALVELDTLGARARFAIDFHCSPVALSPAAEGFAITDGRHPLLLARGGTVVPFDLTMDPAERTLLLSGPNTGGKSVLLKALGLLSAMTQAGIPPTVGAESRLAMVDDIFADIGDEQSIEASLSTFSAHLRNLGEILARATARSLVLIDELGSGTDPAEGAALGGAILEDLTARGTLTVATTHLGALKLLATDHAGVVNASLQFDEAVLAPTYRLTKGVPGRSYGIGIARRLGLPDAVLVRAEERLPAGERDVAALLADLEQRDSALGAQEREAADRLERAEARLARLDARERLLRERERSHERRAREETKRYLLDARAEVERVVRQLERGVPEEGVREARRRVEELAGEQTAALGRLDAEEAGSAPADQMAPSDEPLAVGDAVAVSTIGGRLGRVLELRGSDAVVAVGALKLSVPQSALARSRSRLALPEEPVRVTGDVPDEHASTEVDLRGMRVDEMERALLYALDSAVRSDLKMIRIIHGKGTGALRERVSELLRGDPRVREFRWGAWNEGGIGVTIAALG